MLALLVVLALVPQASRSEPLTLDQIVERVRTEHPLLVASRERIAAAEGARVSSSRWLNPDLLVSGENFPWGNWEEFDGSTDLDVFVVGTQTIETAGRRGHRTRAAEYFVEQARLRHEALELEVVYRVKVAYEDVIAADAKRRLSQDSLERLDGLVELNRIRSVEGYVAEGDYIKSRLEAQRFNAGVRRAELAYDEARIHLAQAMGLTEFDIEVAPADARAELFDVDPASARERVLLRPEIRAAETAVARADALVELAQAEAYPNVSALFGYKRSGPDNTWTAGVTLPLPLFDRNQGGILGARAERAAALAELELTKSRILGELEAALAAVRSTRGQVESLQTDFIERADQSRAVALAAYREGATDLLVVLEAERARNGAQELLVDAIHEERVALWTLERALGPSEVQ
jgi:cobalt-zinc-cadmium efflux system outer membrane protein